MQQIVFIPGTLCDSSIWQSVVQALPPQFNHNFIDITKPYASLTELLEAILNQISGNFILCGFSLGGHIALEIMRHATSRVQKLILMSTTDGELTASMRQGFQQALAMIERGLFNDFIHLAYRHYFTSRHVQAGKFQASFCHMTKTLGPEVAKRQLKLALNLQTFTAFSDIDCPVLLIGGTEDMRTSPVIHQQLASRLANSELHLINDASHFTMLEQPQAVSQLINQFILQ